MKSDSYGCDKCRKAYAADLERIDVRNNEYLSGKAYDTVTRYRCSACGSLWQRVTGGGVGGADNYWGPAE